jgi:histidine triad (HIT) family protein
MVEETIFSKIIRKEIPAEVVFENDKVLAFRDINPQAPVHVLVIPKRPVVDLAAADAEMMADLLEGIKEVVKREGLLEGGYRVVTNAGKDAGQTVFHLHMHVLGGRLFAWPPG